MIIETSFAVGLLSLGFVLGWIAKHLISIPKLPPEVKLTKQEKLEALTRAEGITIEEYAEALKEISNE